MAKQTDDSKVKAIITKQAELIKGKQNEKGSNSWEPVDGAGYIPETTWGVFEKDKGYFFAKKIIEASSGFLDVLKNVFTQVAEDFKEPLSILGEHVERINKENKKAKRIKRISKNATKN